MIKNKLIGQRSVFKNLKWKTDLKILGVNCFVASVSMHNSQDRINYISIILSKF